MIRHPSPSARATARRRARRDSILIAAISAVVAVAGDPRPVALVVAGAGALTAGFIVTRDLDQGDPQ